MRLTFLAALGVPALPVLAFHVVGVMDQLVAVGAVVGVAVHGIWGCIFK